MARDLEKDVAGLESNTTPPSPVFARHTSTGGPGLFHYVQVVGDVRPPFTYLHGSPNALLDASRLFSASNCTRFWSNTEGGARRDTVLHCYFRHDQVHAARIST